MPLDVPDRNYCEAALGYAELGIFDDDKAELENVDPFNRATPEVLRVRVAICRGLEKWDLLRIVALQLTRLEPTNVQWVVSIAYATRRAVSIEFARDILQAAKPNSTGGDHSIQSRLLPLSAPGTGYGEGLPSRSVCD